MRFGVSAGSLLIVVGLSLACAGPAPTPSAAPSAPRGKARAGKQERCCCQQNMDQSYAFRTPSDCANGGTCVKDQYCRVPDAVCCEYTGKRRPEWLSESECRKAGGAPMMDDGCTDP